MSTSPAQRARLARYLLQPAEWDSQMTEAAKRIPCDAPGDFAAILEAEVRAGASKVCTMTRDGERLGYVVFRTQGNELVVDAAIGTDARTNLADVFLPKLEAVARAAECDSIRFHTARPGLIRRGLDHGYHLAEVVMRKAVK